MIPYWDFPPIQLLGFPYLSKQGETSKGRGKKCLIQSSLLVINSTKRAVSPIVDSKNSIKNANFGHQSNEEHIIVLSQVKKWLNF